VPYAQALAPLRRFLIANQDMSGPDAVRALEAASGAPVVVAPVLLYDRGAWKARAEIRDGTDASLGRIETDAIESSLTKEAAATLVGSLARKIEARFRQRRWTLRATTPPPTRLASLEAARAFEEGVNAYDTGEFAAARNANRVG